MASTFSLSPMLTSNGIGSFSVQSDGLVQGTAFDDPAVRFYLAQGSLASTETLPMWGGVAITENILNSTGDALGASVARATAVANITGFSTYNQATAWLTSPQSEAPSASVGMTVPFFRLGSGARLAVAADPSLVSLQTGAINQNVSWDFNNQRLQPYDAATATVSVTSLTASYASGVWTFAVVAAAATVVGAVGDAINLSGVTGTGASLINGNQIVTAFTDNQHFSFQITAGASVFTAGAQTGTIVLNEGIGALNVKVLTVNVGNSKIISYDSVNNLVHWTNTGTSAVILL